jgi:hypothetical protein
MVYPSITVPSLSGPITQNLDAVYTGDFNVSWAPGVKSTGSLRLDIAKTMMVQPGVEFELPIFAGSAMDVTAISMILNFPSEKLEVLGAYLINEPNTAVQANVYGNELRIGWHGAPVSVATGDRLVTLRLKLTSALAKDETIAIELNGSPLNELADANIEVIPNAILFTDNIGSTTIGMGEATASNLGFANYPNPFGDNTTFVYSLPFTGDVLIEVYDMVGKKVGSFTNQAASTGEHKLNINTGLFKPGVYTATLTLNHDGNVIKRTIKIIRNQ